MGNHGHLVAPAVEYIRDSLVYLFLSIVSRTDFDSDRKYLIARKALDRNVDFGHTLIDLPKEWNAAIELNQHDEVRKILSKLNEKLTAIDTILQDIRTAS